MVDKPVTPGQAEDLAKQAVGQYLTACRMAGREQISNDQHKGPRSGPA